VADPVQFGRRDAGDHVGADHVQDIGGQAPGNAHRLLFRRRLDRDLRLTLHEHNVGWAIPLFRRDKDGIKRGVFSQPNPHAYRHVRLGAGPKSPVAACGSAED
jgi:hypothetical protein